MMRIVRNCFDANVYNVLLELENRGENTKAVLMFNHGLGDVINFIPIFNKLQSQFKNHDLYLGMSPDRNFKFLHEKIRFLNPPYGRFSDQYDFIFDIAYVEPPMVSKVKKPVYCNMNEIGFPSIDDVELFKLDIKKKKTNNVGFHFFGHTNVLEKKIDIDVFKIICNKLKEYKLNLIDLQMIPIERIDVIPDFDIGCRSLRSEFPNLKLLANEIANCDYFVGIESGPFYLAGSILGYKNCICLETTRKVSKYTPVNVITNTINMFSVDSIDDTFDIFLKGIVQ